MRRLIPFESEKYMLLHVLLIVGIPVLGALFLPKLLQKNPVLIATILYGLCFVIGGVSLIISILGIVSFFTKNKNANSSKKK